MKYPFEEEKISEKEFIRTFSINENSEEFNWHRDAQERLIKVLDGEGWIVQMDNFVPMRLMKGMEFTIPKFYWHRVIKPNPEIVKKDLKVKITLLD